MAGTPGMKLAVYSSIQGYWALYASTSGTDRLVPPSLQTFQRTADVSRDVEQLKSFSHNAATKSLADHKHIYFPYLEAQDAINLEVQDAYYLFSIAVLLSQISVPRVELPPL